MSDRRSRPTPRPASAARAALPLAVALCAGAASAARAQATDVGAATPARVVRSRPIQVRALVGAYLPTGRQRDQFDNAVLVGVSGSYAITPTVTAVGTLGWSPTKDRQFAGTPRVNVFQYDLGVEMSLVNVAAFRGALRPFIGVGGAPAPTRSTRTATTRRRTSPGTRPWAASSTSPC